ncbi:ubiquitinyl hydrolase 1 [Dictyocaulus viviparus]|uniref:ubiquitinyl hydrolase 1 n=1 Tax=Dictyocaulus viviparus TaxID=29172 RepID=A0A0D8XR73_DICVI|nr:ubiquitinyl hydrolase 1 [Dictyocaulus viviparus]
MTRIEDSSDDNTAMENIISKKSSNQVTLKELNDLISDVQEYPLKPDSNWYVVSNMWWSKVLEAARQGYVEDIPPIDNSSISCKSGDVYFLRSNLAESIDFHLLPEPVFNRLKEAYGLKLTNRDYICRQVVLKNGKAVVEVYPRIVMVYLARDNSKYCELRLTGNDTLVDLRDRALESLGLSSCPPEKLRFYISHGDKYELVDISQQNVDSYFDTAQKVVMVFRVISHLPIHNELALALCHYYVLNSPSLDSYQCLSNVPELTEYFLSNKYIADINKKNPLGTHGELARAYGDLLHNIWSGEHCSVVPRKVKMTIGQFAPRFSGYAQQDSQELLAYVLDGLHEDLNRIKIKPYVPDDETLERLEEHVQAEKSWQAYKARNDSIIVDLVHGQLKSTLVCPVCAKVSIKFDPFCFLSVPLPPKEKVRQVITLIFNSKRRWAKFTITMANSTTVQDAINTMKNSLQNIGNDFTGEIVVYSIGFGELSDEVRLLDPAEPIYIEDRNQSLYACQVDHNPNTHKVVVIKNQTQTGRTLSLPMIFTLPSSDYLTRSFIASRVLPFISDTFIKSSLELCLNEDHSKIVEEREQYKLFIMHGVNAVPFPTNDEPVLFPSGLQIHTVVLQWKIPQIFNQYRGADLIDREVSVSSRKDIHLMECVDLFTKQEQLGEEDSWWVEVFSIYQKRKRSYNGNKMDFT